jgi:hypothetical protein
MSIVTTHTGKLHLPMFARMPAGVAFNVTSSAFFWSATDWHGLGEVILGDRIMACLTTHFLEDGIDT